MAEPTTPSGPSLGAPRPPVLASTADAAPYVPVSWIAVSAMLTAAVFVVILLVGGYWAWQGKRPLLMDWALVLPVGAVVLSFAARRIIRNSEGTRTGVLFGADLVNAAWWTAVVTGLGYLAYLVAIDYAIQRDARAEIQRWTDLVLKTDDPAALTRAFHRTRDPNERAAIGADNSAALEARYRNDYVGFQQCDLVSLAKRNPGACEFTVGGLREWVSKPTGVDCTVTGTLKCPEGTFPVYVALRKIETVTADQTVERQWQVVMNPSGFVQKEQVRLTDYGWAVAQLEMSGVEFGRKFIMASGASRDYRLLAYLEAAQANDDPLFRPVTPGGQLGWSAGAGSAVAVGLTALPVFLDTTADRLFRLEGGAEPSADQKKRFGFAWQTFGLTRPGDRLRDSSDVHEMVAITDSEFDVRLPVEIPLPAPKGVTNVARGRVVVACTDPAVLTELRQLRTASDPAQASATPIENRLPTPTWKLVRIESNLQEIMIRPQGPPGAGGPGGR